MTVLVCIGIGIASFLLPLPVFFRLVMADHLVPRVVRELPITVAALLTLLNPTTPESLR